MVKCNFCGTNIPRGTGKIFVAKDGRVFNLCSIKCEKNMFKLKRKARNTKWTEAYKKEKTAKKVNKK